MSDPTKTEVWHALLRVVNALVALAALILLVWIAVAGPVTVFRIIRYGDTNIDDFSHYPGRTLYPSPSPAAFDGSREAIDLDSATITALGTPLDELLDANGTIAFVLLRHGDLTVERYYQGHTATSRSQLFSVSKSVTSALIGAAIEDGYLAGVDQPITTLVPELEGRGYGPVTLHHLLSMTSGSSYRENDNPFGIHVILNYTPHLERRILTFRAPRAPGETFRYRSGDNALLGLALARALKGETITDYAQRRLWLPLGMQDGGTWTLDHAGNGLEKTWCCLAISARDLAKFGQLYLDGGIWEGEQLLPAAWVRVSTQVGHIPSDGWPAAYTEAGWRNYGYQWWLASEATGDFFALGKDGQFLYVNPAQDVVIVRLGSRSGSLPSSEWIRLFQALAGATELR